MPGANELSTVEWHSAHVMPTRVSVFWPLLDLADDADDRVELQQRDGRRR